jgi:hypothetical protein
MLLGLGETLKKWQELKTFIDKLPPNQLRDLQKKIDTAILIANINAHAGLFEVAYRNWQDIFRRWPNASLAQQSFVWFLIDNDFTAQLQHTLKRWCKLFIEKPALWEVYYSALEAMAEHARALQVMLYHPNKVVGYEKLATISELFTQTDNDHAAYYTGRKALALLMKQIAKQGHKVTQEQEVILAQLMNKFAPVANTYQVIAHLSQSLFKNKDVDNQVLDWAINQDRYELASYIKKMHDIFGMKTDPGKLLSVALAYNDRTAMGYLLQNYANRLPSQDRVTAADRIENRPLAETLAYVGLQEHPTVSPMYDLFKDTMLPRSNKAYIGSYYKGYDSVTGPLESIGARFYVTPSLSISPFTKAWFTHTTNTDNNFWVPNRDVIGGIKVKKFIHNGFVYFKVAERSSLESFAVASLGLNQKLSSKWTSDLLLGYHKLADETLYLELGGMKNEARVKLNYELDSYNEFEAHINVDQFLGQDNTHLGTGQELELHWENKLFLSYPDWNINLYGYWNKYQYALRPLSPQLQRFFEPDDEAVADTSFIMPESYTQLEFSVGVGQRYKEEYTQSIKGFFEAGLSYGFPIGIGETIQGGVSSSVFGRDHLVLYGEYSNNQLHAGQDLFKIGMRYDTFF